MAIVNRTKDISEQREIVSKCLQAQLVGTVPLHLVPYPGQLQAASAAFLGVSGAMTVQLGIQRFIAGAGLTLISVGSALSAVNLGTSGIQDFVIPTGASAVPLYQDDVLTAVYAAGNNVNFSAVTFVIQALQDIKSPLGLTS